MVEAVAEIDDELTHKLPRRRRDRRRRDQARPAPGTLAGQHRPGPVRLRAQEQGRAADARRGGRLPAVAARRAAGDRASTRDRRRRSSARPTTTSRSARWPSRSSPTRSSASWPSSGSTRARSRPARTSTTRPRTSASASAACCRCTPTSARRSTRSTRATSPRSSGLKNTFTGDTLCDRTHPIVLEAITFPEPVISVAIEPKTKADQDKMGIALQRLAEEDPTFRVRTDAETGQTIIAGHGRAAPRGHRRPHDARVQGRRQRRPAAGGLPRDDHAAPPRATAASCARPAAGASTATR